MLQKELAVSGGSEDGGEKNSSTHAVEDSAA
jgi:hypothetical protein